jgi:hypothetical protein
MSELFTLALKPARGSQWISRPFFHCCVRYSVLRSKLHPCMFGALLQLGYSKTKPAPVFS